MEEVISMRPVVSTRQAAVQANLHVSSDLIRRVKEAQGKYQDSTEWVEAATGEHPELSISTDEGGKTSGKIVYTS